MSNEYYSLNFENTTKIRKTLEKLKKIKPLAI